MSGGYGFTYSSSPPSTPPGVRHGWKKPNSNSFDFGGSADLSTTPAGVPPSSTGSFTPAGLPPSSVFQTSQAGGKSLFESVPRLGENSPQGSSTRFSTSPGKEGRSPKKSPRREPNYFSPLANESTQLPNLQVSPQRSLGQLSGDDSYDEDEDGDYEPDSYEEDSEDGYDDDEDASVEGYKEDAVPGEDMDMDRREEILGTHSVGSTDHSLWFPKSYDGVAEPEDLKNYSPPRGMKRSIQGAPKYQTTLYKPGAEVAKKTSSAIFSIVRDISRQLGASKLEELDDLILDTETYVSRTYPEEIKEQDTEDLIEAALLIVPDALCKLWQNCCNQTKRSCMMEQEYVIGIGPGDEDHSFHKAAYVADLLLKLYHPPSVTGKQSFATSRSSRPPFDSLLPFDSPREEAYPKVLLDWLERNHNPYENALARLKSHQPNPTAHASFWDILFAAALRGKIRDIISILDLADFSYARTAREDNHSGDGYDQRQIAKIVKVVHQLVEVLQSCPGVRDDDWFVYGNDWVLFRRRVQNALGDLASFAEGGKRTHGVVSSDFDASDLGLTRTSAEFSRSARRASSKVPWMIYQNVKAFYGLLLGGTAELLSSSQDWLEATIALAVWWDGDDDEGFTADKMARSRHTFTRPSIQTSRLVDTNPRVAYRKRIAAAFERVTNESIDDALQIDSTNFVEVAIASVFEGDTEGTLGVLQAWSMPIAAAVVEIASQGGWYESPPGVAIKGQGFNESDLMVLSYGQIEHAANKDGILSKYADLLFSKGQLKHSNSKEAKEGWELSLEILGRLDDTALANKKIGDALSQLPVDSDERADKLIDLCRAFGLEKDACSVAEKYADLVAETTDKYGTALIYYARAHNMKKVKDVLDLLNSYCLVQSAAFPPAWQLDPHLSNILANPHESLLWLAGHDFEASEILSVQMSGYATIRRFYELRDGQFGSDQLGLRPAARKKAAATSLLTVIGSAADNIHGGLYDEESPAVVPIDGLLVLLGEAMVFVDKPVRILALKQLLVLLRAIEDLQTVHTSIQARCVECLSATLASACGNAAPADPRDLMKKSISDLTASTGFSLVGSSMLGSGKGNDKDSRSRGWDWRVGLKTGAGAKEIISMLRVGVARDVSRAWMDGEEI